MFLFALPRSDSDAEPRAPWPTERTGFYVQAEQRLAALIPEIPLYRKLIVNSLSVRLAGVKNNDLIWDYNTADWFCLPGGDGRGVCQA